MAISEQQRQKKLAKKKKKRSATTKVMPTLSMKKAKAYASFPLHECLIPTNLFEIGLGDLVVARRAPNGNIAMSAFVIDVFCLGVKDALFLLVPEDRYENEIKVNMANAGNRQFEKIHQSCAKSLLYGLVDYAKGLGFSPHPDFQNAKDIFGDIDASACPVKYEYGKNGKPFYINGPYESPADVERILNTLTVKCGDGGFDMLYQTVEEGDDDTP